MCPPPAEHLGGESDSERERRRQRGLSKQQTSKNEQQKRNDIAREGRRILPYSIPLCNIFNMNTVVIARFYRGITPPSDREDDNNSPSYNTVICTILVLT